MPFYTLPPDREPPSGYWASCGRPSGVQGGISVTGILNVLDFGAVNTGNIDCAGAVSAAISACHIGSVVWFPPGFYQMSQVTFPTQGGTFPRGSIRISGSVDQYGEPTVLIDAISSNSPIAIGQGVSWNSNSPETGAIVAGLYKGSTSITVQDATNMQAYRMARVCFGNNPTGTFRVNPLNNLEQYTVFITGKIGNTLYIDPPILEDYPGIVISGSYFAVANQYGVADNYGIEDLMISGNANISVFSAIRFEGLVRSSYLKNIKTRGQNNYGIYLNDTSRCSIQDCWVGTGRQGISSNQAGLLLAGCSANRFENNILVDGSPCVENFGNNFGNVIGYNYAANSNAFVAFNGNHAPYESLNLYEGNAAINIISDGYFGGERKQTSYRNWLFGYNFGIDTTVYNPKRFSRQFNFIGNIGSRPGTQGIDNGISYGTPNLVSPHTYGYANSQTGLWWWDWDTGRGQAKTWSGIIKERVSSNEIYAYLDSGNATGVMEHVFRSLGGAVSINGGGLAYPVFTGANLQLTGNVLRIYNNSSNDFGNPGDLFIVNPSQDGFQETDQGVLATQINLANYNFFSSGIPTGESIGSLTLQDSLYLTGKPDYFTNYGVNFNFPPFDPYAPTPITGAQIPAGWRYFNRQFDPVIPAGGGGVTPQGLSRAMFVRQSAILMSRHRR